MGAILLSLFCSAVCAAPDAGAPKPEPGTRNSPVYDPAIDPATGPFSYLAKPSNLLAVVGQRGATQVTWDGAFYTGAAELCVVTGDPPQPIMVRVKQLGYGHLPIVHYAWQGGEIRYSVTAFAALVRAGGELSPVSFIRIEARRVERAPKGAAPAPTLFGFAIRRSGRDHRARALEAGPVTLGQRYEFGEDWAAVDGAAVCLVPSHAPAKRYAVVGEPYQQAFTTEQFHVQPETATLIDLWDLGPAEELKVDLKMPWSPIPIEAADKLAAVRAANFDAFAAQLAEEWNGKLAQGMDLSFPEEKPLDAYAASLVYTLMAVERKEGEPARLVPRLRAEPLRPDECGIIIHALEVAGHQALARECLMGLLDRQQPDGCLAPQGDPRGHAEVLLATGRHYAFTHDAEWATSVYSKVQKAVGWLSEALVMESAQGGQAPDLAEHWVAPAAVALAADMASALGHADEAATWYEKAAAMLPTVTLVPAVTPDALGPLLSAAGVPSLAARMPSGGLSSALVTGLLQRLHGDYAEGVLAEKGVLSPLHTVEMARFHAARGEQEQALRDLSNLAVHTDASHGGFAAGARAWGDRDSGDDAPPDLVFAAAYATLVREFLVREQGSELHLFSVLSPAWLQPDKPTGVKNAPTSFGVITAVAVLSNEGADVDLLADWKQKPSRIILHLPWFVEVVQVTADQPGPVQREGPPSTAYEARDLPAAPGGAPDRWLELDPNTTHVEIKWHRKETPALSYDEALAAWRDAYRKAYAAHLAAGGDRLTLEPLPLR